MSIYDKNSGQWYTYEDIKKLPLGNVIRKQLEKDLKKEYDKCGVVESKWMKRFPKKYFSLGLYHAIEVCNNICDEFREKRVKKIILESPKVKDWAFACYFFNGEIHFKWKWISTFVLIHELTHHFGQIGHGDNFCEIEEMLFKVTYNILTGKNPKKDW